MSFNRTYPVSSDTHSNPWHMVASIQQGSTAGSSLPPLQELWPHQISSSRLRGSPWVLTGELVSLFNLLSSIPTETKKWIHPRIWALTIYQAPSIHHLILILTGFPVKKNCSPPFRYKETEVPGSSVTLQRAYSQDRSGTWKWTHVSLYLIISALP